ncbi:protein MpRLK-Pelle_L-LEC26 [Marchantia polymorpha subsp. ruderalis]|uniref:Protein kinase domain-containing protein n=2 Tax=Marchantia polymorpha TaxID=3197 RepID=A0AAF6BN90_MARPO|nr:hypothetical protein MARPO_0034s0139 [Marchantia polymorpha]BAF79949.1 receptor-like kinase [Marchantia polymorpha]BBN13474.1 hypothetical protein Mp_6g03790 [Marchantia polymorpha subsp. ruderalis]|eukprot:PTQ41566.1 hypothetical protein MARPO_0034s0139 [Marchantia polymorpha]
MVMGGPRHRVLVVYIAVCLLLGCTRAQQTSSQTSNFWYSAHSAVEVPFSNQSINVFAPASGFTAGGTALCLTQPIPTGQIVNADASGRGLAVLPVQVRDPATHGALSWSTMFSFWIQSNSAYDPGEGFAFIMSPDNSSTGSAGSFLGWLNGTTQGQALGNFAVEFDTVQNAEFQDPARYHVGVNVDSLVSRCTQQSGYWDAGEFRQFSLTSDDEVWIYAWIDYDAGAKLISVTVSPSKARPMVPMLTCALDLSPVLRDEMYVGFTASTGNDNTTEKVHMSQHSVYEWSFSSNGSAPENIFGNVWISNLAPPKTNVLPIAIGVAGGAGLVLLVALLGAAVYVRKYKPRATSFQVAEFGVLDCVRGPQIFSYKELSNATKAFSEKQLLGRGGFGKVYKGALSKTGEEMAVKRISKTSTQGAQEFVAEVKVIGRVRHRNLVPLLGWCHERGELLLVYELMPNGSLDNLLFDRNMDPAAEVLSWSRRVKILSGVGAALAFLHEEWEQRVVHRDVKASNVMLDAEFNARLGDFGLARLYDHSQAPNSTLHIAGTVGYMAPELFNNGKATEKTDVYSFGALALEIATGLQASSTPDKSQSLVDWVWTLYRDDRILEAADSRLEQAFDIDEMTIVLQVGLLCSHPDADSRPTMRQSLAILKGEVPLPMLPLTKPLPTFAFSMKRSDYNLFSDTATPQADFDEISLDSPNTKSSFSTWSTRSIDHTLNGQQHDRTSSVQPAPRSD